MKPLCFLSVLLMTLLTSAWPADQEDAWFPPDVFQDIFKGLTDEERAIADSLPSPSMRQRFAFYATTLGGYVREESDKDVDDSVLMRWILPVERHEVEHWPVAYRRALASSRRASLSYLPFEKNVREHLDDAPAVIAAIRDRHGEDIVLTFDRDHEASVFLAYEQAVTVLNYRWADSLSHMSDDDSEASQQTAQQEPRPGLEYMDDEIRERLRPIWNDIQAANRQRNIRKSIPVNELEHLEARTLAFIDGVKDGAYADLSGPLYFELSQLYYWLHPDGKQDEEVQSVVQAYMVKALRVYDGRYDSSVAVHYSTLTNMMRDVKTYQAYLEWLKRLHEDGNHEDIFPLRGIDQMLEGKRMTWGDDHRARVIESLRNSGRFLTLAAVKIEAIKRQFSGDPEALVMLLRVFPAITGLDSLKKP